MAPEDEQQHDGEQLQQQEHPIEYIERSYQLRIPRAYLHDLINLRRGHIWMENILRWKCQILCLIGGSKTMLLM